MSFWKMQTCSRSYRLLRIIKQIRLICLITRDDTYVISDSRAESFLLYRKVRSDGPPVAKLDRPYYPLFYFNIDKYGV